MITRLFGTSPTGTDEGTDLDNLSSVDEGPLCQYEVADGVLQRVRCVLTAAGLRYEEDGRDWLRQVTVLNIYATTGATAWVRRGDVDLRIGLLSDHLRLEAKVKGFL